MGQFSWICSDSQEPAYNEPPKKTYYLLVPEDFQDEFGKFFQEDDYDGYGVFGGRDAYALVAQWNEPEKCKNPDGTWKSDDECRMVGIDIACYDNAKLKYPIKIVEDSSLSYGSVEPSENDPNQGWHDRDSDGNVVDDEGRYWFDDGSKGDFSDSMYR